ncbi:MAG: hypothetical protein Tsb0017_08520 [Geothermobacteraceae bacterium]
MRQRLNDRSNSFSWKIFGAPVLLALVLLLTLPGMALSFTVSVVDNDGNPVNGFRYLVEEDNTVQTPPGVSTAFSTGLSIHKSYTPVVAEGETDTDSATISLPDGRYVVSVRPFDGYTMSGNLVKQGQTEVTVVVHKLPIPTTQISILVFQDHGPINNAPDMNVYEPGLAGFSIQVHDMAGQVMQDAFGNPLGTDYDLTCVQALPDPSDPSACITTLGNGTLLTDANGEVTIKFLAPGKYGILVAAPPAQADQWVQTATIEGTRTIDAWVKADEPAQFIEGFGPGFYHVFVGFVNKDKLPWLDPANPGWVDRSGYTGQITGINRFNHFSRPPNLQGFFAGPTVDGCWVGLNDPVTGQGLYAAPCDSDGSFTIDNVPPGTYELVTWDENLDALFGFNTVMVPPGAGGTGDVVDLGNVLSFRWFGTLKGSIFLDANENGYRDPGEIGIPNHDVVLRFRNGTIYQLTTSDIFGEYEFAEVFPFFKWLVVEVGFATLKATGMTAVVDNGGPVDPTDPLAAGLDTTGWPDGTVGVLRPQPQFRRGTISYDPATDTFSGVEKINPNTGNNLSRTVKGEVLTQAMHLFLNQTNIIDWGKNNYSPGENGGISGLVIYNVTRPNDDPLFEGQEDWEPGIPFAQVNLYMDDDQDGVIDDINGDGKVTRADVDNYPQGNFPGPEDVDRAPKGVFNWGDAVNVTWTDSWDATPPRNCVQNLPVINGQTANECFDNFGTWNQVRNGVFDGGFAFTSYFPNGPNGQEVSPLPEGVFIVGAPTPPGYVLSKEEDKNVDFGETYTPSTLALPFPCVGKDHTVSDYLEFQLDATGQPYSVIDPADLVSSVFAGQQRPLCNMKQVALVEAKNTGVEFYFHTRVPKAARNVGFVNNDLAAEFDQSSPIFGEKAAPKWIPISYRDWAGNEVARVYSDEYGAYEALLPSTFNNNLPSPSGFSPNMLTLVLNDPGPIPDPDNPGKMIIDPNYKPEFAVAPWTFQFTPGQVTYTDTPIVPLAGFATLPPGAELKANPVAGTPIPASVERLDPSGALMGPLVCGAGDTLILSSGIGTGDQSGFGPLPPSTATGTVELVDAAGTAYGLDVVSWSPRTVEVTVPQAVIDAGITEAKLVVTRGDNGLQTLTSVTVHIRDCTANPPIIVAQDGSGDYTKIQDAIDAANPGDLIIVRPGVYNENVVLYKEVILQGSGAGSKTGANTTTINAAAVPRNNLDAWHAKVLAVTGADPFNANEAPGIMVLGNATATPFAPGGPHAWIDGFHVIGGISGGGIYVASDGYEVEISNNKIAGNQGSFGGGITVGTPDTGIDANNDGVHIHHNHITRNGGVQGGGGISLYKGADNYLVEHNLITANFSRYTGGGINHVGFSTGGQIANNQILFNEVFFGALLQGAGDGGGIFIGGEMVEGEGAGVVTIADNLIQGNLTGSGNGGGLMAWAFNSTNEIGPSTLNLVNNIIVNNVAGLAGGGVHLEDVASANLVNNTIVNNDSTATAALAFGAGQVHSTPQPAGLVIRDLNATLLGGGADLSGVTLLNNYISDNRSFFNNADLNSGAGGLSPGSQHAGVMGDSTLDYPDVWDLQIDGSNATVDGNLLSALTRTLAVGATTGPTWDYSGGTNIEPSMATLPYQFVKPYQNNLAIATVLDEGGNAITVRFTPLDVTAGDYHLLPSSDAVDAGQAVGAYPLAAADYDGDGRPVGSAVDIGADEFTVPDASAVRVISPNGGDVLAAGSVFPICWEAPAAATNFKVKYSLDGGSSYNTIDLAATGPCIDWTVPTTVLNKKNVLIKVRGETGTGAKVGVDTSDAPFTIEVLRLLAPNGGEVLSSGGNTTVSWLLHDPTSVDRIVVEYRKRPGKPWELIADLTGLGGTDPGSVVWDPIVSVQVPKNDLRVRVSAYDSGGTLLARDKSDAGVTLQAVAP